MFFHTTTGNHSRAAQPSEAVLGCGVVVVVVVIESRLVCASVNILLMMLLLLLLLLLMMLIMRRLKCARPSFFQPWNVFARLTPLVFCATTYKLTSKNNTTLS